MTLKVVLVASAIYLGLIGLGVMFAPQYFGIGAVPPDAPPALIAFLRIFAGPCLGIAVLNWMTRNSEPSPERNAIVLANIVGFGCVTAVDVWGVFSGDARQIAKVFLVVHLLFTLAFVVAGGAGMRETAWTREGPSQ
jgi:uncharacterized membrane protein